MRYVWIAVFALLTLATRDAWAADFTVTVTTNGSGQLVWSINNQLNPTLTLVRGNTYTFDVQAANHPFDIKTAQVTGTADRFDTGVTGQGVTNGTLTFAVPTDPTTPPLFYQCEVHGTMTGVLSLVAPAPTAGPWAVAVLAFGLALGGFLALRARRRAAVVS
jgi:hypothetical protein